MKFVRNLFLFLALLNVNLLFGQDKMEWFGDARLGIFIHWGIYAVKGTSESWAFYNKQVPYDEYMSQIKGFTASRYKPEAWAKLIKESGAGYAVITSKHHDGVSLYNTKMNTLSIPRMAPAKRDVLTPFVNALRQEGIKVGLYYSLIDWSHPNYPAFTKDSLRYKVEKDSIRWKRFKQFYMGQIEELSQQFNPDLFWFDGDWEHSSEEWEAPLVRQKILAHNPNAIINGRLQGHGDYGTPEQHIPVSRPNQKYWELCMTSNDNWGYRHIDSNFKTPYEVISQFADVVSMGGNLLLDIGPKEDGTIPEQQVHLLQELGKWNKKHAEAIFGSLAGLPYGHYYGASTLSKDSSTLYLFVSSRGANEVFIKGLNNKISKAELLGTNVTLQPKVVGKISWSKVPGLVYLSVPDSLVDEYISVIKLTLEGKVSLYRGKGGFD